MKKYLGIDVGTTSLKAAVFDENGKRLALRTEDYTLDTDPETGFIEFDPEEYIRLTEKAIRELKEECGGIDALSVDTQGETMILTDRDGKPLYPAVVWLDNRADMQAGEIKEKFGCRRVYEVTGQPEITAGWPASKLLWFRENRPDIFDSIGRIFLLEDWILYRLSGEFVTEPTIQSSSIYYDIVNRCWWTEMLDYLRITTAQLPRLCSSAQRVGTYEGIPVVTGGLDQIAGTLGCGVTDGSRISEMTGTIMAICVVSDTMPPFREDCVIPCHMHALDGKYCLLLWTGTAGMALKWFRNNLSEGFDFKQLDELAEQVPAGCDGLTALPYFTGSTMPKYNPEATASFTGLNLGHTRAHFVRAILESVAFLLRQDLEYLAADAVKEIRITGGGAASPLWAQIKADVTGRNLCTVSESETACLGTAMFAAVGIGDFSDMQEACGRLVNRGRTYAPSEADYSEAYERFSRLDNVLNRRNEECQTK